MIANITIETDPDPAFTKWWKQQGFSYPQAPILAEAFRDLAYRAWEAGIDSAFSTGPSSPEERAPTLDDLNSMERQLSGLGWDSQRDQYVARLRAIVQRNHGVLARDFDLINASAFEKIEAMKPLP